jgi:hypothetical protein
MPALPSVSKVVRVDYHFSEAADPNVQIRTFWQYSGTLSLGDATTWLASMQSALATFMASYMQPTITLAFSELTDLSSPTAPQVVNSTGATGGAGAAPLSAGVAMVMKYHITRRYRGGKPRAYLPGMSSAYLTTPTEWNPASLANVTAGWITHLTAIAAATPVAAGTGTHVNISYYQGFTNHTYPSGRVKPIPTPRVTPLVDTINNVSGNPTPGSQRRRNEQP